MSGMNVEERAAYGRVKVMLEEPKALASIASACTANLEVRRVVREALSAVGRNPQLLQCTPLSIYNCVLAASELGLELAGPLGQAWMVPRRKGREMEATFQVGYRGLMTLAYRSGHVKSFSARIVYEGEVFEVRYGLHETITHLPLDAATVEQLAGREPRAVAYYAVIHYVTGGYDFEVMWKPQVEAFAAKYAASDRGPWKTHFNEMALKTVIKKVAKRCPLSPEALSQLQREDQEDRQAWGSASGGLPALPSRTQEVSGLLDGPVERLEGPAPQETVPTESPVAATGEVAEQGDQGDF